MKIISKNSHIFPDDFITKCKQFPNVPQTISGVVKNNIKRMAMEQSLYTQVIKFRQRDLKFDSFLFLSAASNIKSFRRNLITCTYKLCSINIRFMLYFTTPGMVCGSFVNCLHFVIKSSGNI